jgi:hypothetical protein
MADTRPLYVDDAVVDDRHRAIAEHHATRADNDWDYDGPALGVCFLAFFALVAGCAAASGAPTTLLSVSSVAAGVAGCAAIGYLGLRRVASNEMRRARFRYARAAAYLEAIRGTDMTAEVTSSGADIAQLAENVAYVARAAGAPKAHQLLVRAHQQHRLDVFGALTAAELAQERRDCLGEVVDTLLGTREPFGTSEDISRLFDAIDQRRIDMLL